MIEGFSSDEPFVLIGLIQDHSVVTWQPPGMTRPETWVERKGRLLSKTVAPTKGEARAQHERIVARLREILSANSRSLLGWLRQGVEAGMLRPVAGQIELTPAAHALWDLLGSDVSLLDADQDRLAIVEVCGLTQVGVLGQDGPEEPG